MSSLLRKPLNERQLQVLAWIADGCPEGVMVGTAHKVSAQALKDRRLVTIDKGHRSWAAAVTDAGSFYLQHNSYPPGMWDGKTRAPVTKARPAKPARASPPRQQRPPSKPGPTEQLVAQILAAGGDLTVQREHSGPDPEALARSAIRFGKVPPGQLLVVRTVGRRDTVRLQLKPWQRTSAAPIVVPATLRDPHPVVAALRQPDSELAVVGEPRRDALAGEGVTSRPSPDRRRSTR